MRRAAYATKRGTNAPVTLAAQGMCCLCRVEVRVQQIAAERVVLSQDGPAPIHEFWQWGDVLVVI